MGERLGGYIGERADPKWTIPNGVMTYSTLKVVKKKVGAFPSREAISQRPSKHQVCLREMVSGLCITWVFFFFTSFIKLLYLSPHEYSS